MGIFLALFFYFFVVALLWISVTRPSVGNVIMWSIAVLGLLVLVGASIYGAFLIFS